MHPARHGHPSKRAVLQTPLGGRSQSKGDGAKRPSGVRIKRAYAPREPQDGQRVLVDRLWPRGLSKHDLEDAVWIRDVAPSASLRKWFGHKPERWAGFRRRYFAELRLNPAVKTLQEIVADGPVTLIYGARDEIHNQAVALAEYLDGDTEPAEEADQ
jgi:uncharacterized protein YeaO (DUF488 family)